MTHANPVGIHGVMGDLDTFLHCHFFFIKRDNVKGLGSSGTKLKTRILQYVGCFGWTWTWLSLNVEKQEVGTALD